MRHLRIWLRGLSDLRAWELTVLGIVFLAVVLGIIAIIVGPVAASGRPLRRVCSEMATVITAGERQTETGVSFGYCLRKMLALRAELGGHECGWLRLRP